MKWVAAVLLVVNVLVFLGISNHQVESVQFGGEARQDINRDSMLLLKEAVPDAPAPSAGGREDPAAAGPGRAGDDGTLSDAESAMLPEGEHVCVRVGPFHRDEHWDGAREWVRQQPWASARERSASRELRAVRVYLGPFGSGDSAQSTMEMLAQKDLDHFYYLREGKGRISLGYFTQEELALRYVEYLQDQQEVDARSQPEYRTLGPLFWLDVTAESGFLGQLLERDWLAEGVRVSEKACDALETE